MPFWLEHRLGGPYRNGNEAETHIDKTCNPDDSGP